MTRLRVALCQLNPVVGDLAGNTAAVIAAMRRADSAGADMAVFSELVLCGYPPEDLLLKPGFVADNLAALDQVAQASGRCVAVVGFVDERVDLYNAAAICAEGEIKGVYHKANLPNYSVFDEQRYFARGSGAGQLFLVGGVRVGISICEDAWDPSGPIAAQAAAGAELMVNINASPFYARRLAERERMLATRAADASCPLVYVNMVGGQDELVFDGASLVLDANGAVVAAVPQFEQGVTVVDVDVRPVYRKRLLDPRGRRSAAPLPVATVTDTPRQSADAARIHPPEVKELQLDEEIYRALVIGTRDYVRKNGFTDVVIGLSGGIDSSLVAVVAVDALGPDHVHGVAMPSRYSSDHSVADAADLVARLGIDHRCIAIEPAHAALWGMLDQTITSGSIAPGHSGPTGDLTEENLQSRIRGVILMALSNRHGWMVLTTGNKSELAVGYSTLYGDTAGGFAVIKDVPKTAVYRLCRWRNTWAFDDAGASRFGGLLGRPGEVVPEAVLIKAPSAELRPDQRDDQSLPPYEVLDPILEAYVEGDLTSNELVEAGHDGELVARIVRLVDLAEYKRRQMPPGVRVTSKAFGKDRRVPITNRYR